MRSHRGQDTFWLFQGGQMTKEEEAKLAEACASTNTPLGAMVPVSDMTVLAVEDPLKYICTT